jgi:hypothetical protein
VIGVDAYQTLPEQVCAKAGSLTSAIDPEPGQIPVGIGRMGGVHLLEDGERVRVLWIGTARAGDPVVAGANASFGRLKP